MKKYTLVLSVFAFILLGFININTANASGYVSYTIGNVSPNPATTIYGVTINNAYSNSVSLDTIHLIGTNLRDRTKLLPPKVSKISGSRISNTSSLVCEGDNARGNTDVACAMNGYTIPANSTIVFLIQAPGGYASTKFTDASIQGIDATSNLITAVPVCSSITINSITYSLNPCTITATMIDGQGNQNFSTTIKGSGGYGFSVRGYGEGFPTYSILGDASGGANGNTLIHLFFNDAVLSANETQARTYSGYLPVHIFQGSETGFDKNYLNLAITLTVLPSPTQPSITLVSQSSFITYNQDNSSQANGTFSFQVNSGSKDIFISRVNPKELVSVIFAGNNIGSPLSAILTSANVSNDDTSDYYKVNQDFPRMFNLSFVIKPTEGTGFYQAKATSLKLQNGDLIKFGSEFVTNSLFLN